MEDYHLPQNEQRWSFLFYLRLGEVRVIANSAVALDSLLTPQGPSESQRLLKVTAPETRSEGTLRSGWEQFSLT